MQKRSLLRVLALVASCFFLLSNLWAQAPQSIPYQAVARNTGGNLLQNQNIAVRFSIRNGSAVGSVLYQERHSVSTNHLGLFNLNIGQGTVLSGAFASINWGTGSKFVQVELDPAGGSSFVDMGTTQMLSVPYALYAATSGSAVTETDPQVSSSTANRVPKWNGTTLTDGLLFDNGTNLGIGTTTPSQKLEIVGTVKSTGIQMPTGAANGYVLQTDASGNASWVAPGSLSVTETDPQVSAGSTNYIPRWNGTALIDGQIFDDGSNVGIGTSSPDARLTVDGKIKTSFFQMPVGAGAGLVLQSDASGNASWVAATSLAVTGDNLGNHAANQNIRLQDYLLTNSNGNYGLRLFNDGTATLSNSGTSAQFNLGGGNNAFSEFKFATQNRDWKLNAGADNFQILDGYTNNAPFAVEKQSASDRVHIKGNYVGIGTSSPAELLDVSGITQTSGFRMPTDASNGYVLQSDASGNASWVAPGSLSITETDPQVTSSATNYVPKWNGTTLTDGLLYDSGTNIGIGTAAPSEKLEVMGSIRATDGYVYLENDNQTFTMRTFPSLNYVQLDVGGTGHSSDAIYLGDVSSGVNEIIALGNVGIGTTSPGQKLEVAGKTKTTNFQMTNGATNGYILQSDASGNASWADPSSSIGAALSAGYLPRWDGSDLVNSDVYNSGNAITIGTATPNSIPDDDNALEIWDEDGTRSDINQVVAGGGVPVHYFTRQQGTLAAPASVEEDNTLGRLTARMYNGTEYLNAAAIVFEADEDPSGDAPGRIEFRTTAVGEQDYSTRMTIKNDGKVGIGTTTPDDELDVDGTIETDNFQMTNGAADGYILQSDGSGQASWVAPGTLSAAIQTKIQDTDTDTKIQVEESSDEDKIRFDLAGTERWVMMGSRLVPVNSGNSVFIGTNAGASDDLTTNNNVAVGYAALQSNTSGAHITAIGTQALYSNSTGNNNTAIGFAALQNNVDGTKNTALGEAAGYANTSGDNNTFLGYYAGFSATGSDNVFLGNWSGYNETGDNKLYIDNSITSSPLIWGDFSSNYVNINGNLGIGTNSPANKLDVEGGIAIGSTYSGTSSAPANGAIIEGNVGIGTTTPTQALLVVSGSESTNIGGYGFINDNGNTGTSSGTHNYSIYATSRVAGSEFNAHSDARIKRVQGRSNNAADLETLMQLKITDYTLIDTVTKGAKPYKKVIAQEVEQVFPQAVSTMAGVTVPDIYQLSNMENGFVALPNSGLKLGERVKLIFGEKQEIAEITAVSNKGFQTKMTAKTGQVFVFGREVSDFRMVDYEALSMLNVSATQALVKRLTELEKQNAALQGKLNDLDKLNTRMDALEAMLKTSANR